MTLETTLRAISRPIRAADLPRSLDHMHSLLAAIGQPQQAFPAVVVAGSVGKGTTCCQIAALLAPHQRIGLYTSPHLHTFRERFQINGRMIDQEAFVEMVSVVTQAAAGHSFSTFELATAGALWWFRQQAIDLAILEIGIGGRFDAVNAVANTLAVITPIEREHAAMLGGDIAAIARHKAGIIQSDGYVISAPQVAAVEEVIRAEAQQRHAHLRFEPVSTLAAAACGNLMERRLSPAFDLPAQSPSVQLAGRMEIILLETQTWVIDGAHTALSARRLRQALDQHFGDQPMRIIAGMLRDKEAHEALTAFDEPRFELVLTQTASHRALTTTELYDAAGLSRARVSQQPDLYTAIEQARHASQAVVVVTGSLRTAALCREVLGLLDSDQQEEASLTRRIFEGSDYLSRLP